MYDFTCIFKVYVQVSLRQPVALDHPISYLLIPNVKLVPMQPGKYHS